MDARRAADRARHPVLRLGLLGALPRRRHRRLRRRVPGRPHAEPLHALQREDQVRRAPRARDRARLRRRVHRALRDAGRRPGRPRAAPRVGCREGPVLRARRAHGRAARAHLLPARRRRRPRRSCAPRPRRAASRVAQKPDSHDICFIPDGDTRGWLAERVGTATGDIVDRTGAVVGSHEGAHAFTVGQRRGLQLGVPAADGKPRFVLEVRPVSNTVVVGPKEALATAEIAGDAVHLGGTAAAVDDFACDVQIRAHADPGPGTARARRRRRDGRPRRALRRRRARPDGRALRRHAGDRAVHDRPHGLGGPRRRVAETSEPARRLTGWQTAKHPNSKPSRSTRRAPRRRASPSASSARATRTTAETPRSSTTRPTTAGCIGSRSSSGCTPSCRARTRRPRRSARPRTRCSHRSSTPSGC